MTTPTPCEHLDCNATLRHEYGACVGCSETLAYRCKCPTAFNPAYRDVIDYKCAHCLAFIPDARRCPGHECLTLTAGGQYCVVCREITWCLICGNNANDGRRFAQKIRCDPCLVNLGHELMATTGLAYRDMKITERAIECRLVCSGGHIIRGAYDVEKLVFTDCAPPTCGACRRIATVRSRDQHWCQTENSTI